jgi:chemotaxis protein CheX
MAICHDDVAQQIEAIWSSVLGWSSTPIGNNPAATARSVRWVTGVVAISGAWEGLVVLQCDQSLARSAASIMFRSAEDDLGRELIHDAVGELTNMIGGNLKALLPEPSQLSLPVVADGVDAAVEIIDGRVLAHSRLECRELPVSVWVLEQRPAEDNVA